MVDDNQIDKAIKFLCDYYKDNNSGHYTTIERMQSYGIQDASSVVDVLEAKGLVTVRKEYKEASRTEYPLRLTSKGKVYFEDKNHEDATSKKQFLHDIIVAVIGAVAGSLLTLLFSYFTGA